MCDIKKEDLKNDDGVLRGCILFYMGSDDPVYQLDKYISEHIGGRVYTEYIDSDMDNPWVRILIF